MDARVVGIAASLVVHGVLVAAGTLLVRQADTPTGASGDAGRPITLAMAENVPPVAPGGVPEPESGPTPASPREPAPAPDSEAELASEPASAPRHESELEPEFEPEPESELASELASEPESALESEPEPEPEPEQEPEPESESAPVPAPEGETAEARASAEQVEAERDYRSRLRDAIFAGRSYPRQARRRRQEGTVVVGLRVLADGTLERLEVRASSGSDALDAAALDAVRSVGQFENLPESIERSFVDFVIPISFRLSS